MHTHIQVQNREMGNRLFAHVTHPHEYAARVHDPHVYHAVSLDLMHRWLYPNVPENNNIHSGDRTTYRCVFVVLGVGVGVWGGRWWGGVGVCVCWGVCGGMGRGVICFDRGAHDC